MVCRVLHAHTTLQSVKDLALTHKKEIEKAGAKMAPEDREARKEVR